MYPPSNQIVSQSNPTATNITPSTFVSRIRIQYCMTNVKQQKQQQEQTLQQDNKHWDAEYYQQLVAANEK